MNTEGERTDFRHIREGFFQLIDCLNAGRISDIDILDTTEWADSEKEGHFAQNAYLLQNETSLLFDTLTMSNTERALETLDSLLDGGELDYLVISHPEANHAGNTFPILEAHPEATLLIPRNSAGNGKGFEAEHELYHISPGKSNIDNEIQGVSEGDTLDLGDFVINFHQVPISDHAFTIWMSEKVTNTLFTVDWMGYMHETGECNKFASELEDDLHDEQLRVFHQSALQWLKFSNVHKVKDAVDELISDFDPDILAPAHGNVVVDHDPAKYINQFQRVAESISEQGDPKKIRRQLESAFEGDVRRR